MTRITDITPIYLINLDRSVGRLATFRERNAHLRDVVRFAAVDGLSLDKERLVAEELLASDCGYGAGAIGCALSHVNLWTKAIDENRSITVFEDDAIAAGRFYEKAGGLILSLPENWDFIQWGYNFNPLYVWLELGFAKANVRFYNQRFQGEDKLTFQSADYYPSAVKLAHSYGTVAYSVSPKGARSLLEHCLPLTSRLIPFPGTDVVAANTGIDCAMCGAYSLMHAFACIPPLVLEDKDMGSERVATDHLIDVK